MAVKKKVKKAVPYDTEELRKLHAFKDKRKTERKKSKNMDAIRSGGQVQNRSNYYEGIDGNGGYFAFKVGNQYFGETKKKTKRPTVKKK